MLASTDGLLLDLRSEAYANLGPLPDRPDAVFVRVVSEDASGRRRALNHFNKMGKGEFVRRLIQAGIDHPDVDALLAWARGAGIRLEPRRAGRARSRRRDRGAGSRRLRGAPAARRRGRRPCRTTA